MAVGVGLAIARAGRDRLDQRARRRRGLGRAQAEPLGFGVRRMALDQLDLAVEMLHGRNGALDEHAVHETRKALKRLRALVRLLADELGQSAYARENDALRRIAGRLSGARDSEVMLATLDALIESHPGKLGGRRSVTRLRARLAREHDEMEHRSLGDPHLRAEVIAELLAVRTRVYAWQLDGPDGIGLVESGLGRIYTQGRRRYRRAAGRKKQRTVAMHEWRKRVKDLRYAAEMLQREEPAGAAALGVATRSRSRRPAAKAARRLVRLERRADELGEMLGEEHDLAVLSNLIGAGTGAGARTAAGEQLPRRTRKLLLRLIERRRARLQDRALRAGGRLYRRPRRGFVRRVRAAYLPARP
jgi:CHAD domain-containing protein